ncbi:MAG TPA: AI-2E family transporter [Phenylobacterium sp.]|nr:AI-2E family transporter [Phenylobacterium sp.]
MIEVSPQRGLRTAVVIIAVIAVGAALAWLAPILTPLALAVFLAVMIDGFSRVIRQHAPFLPGAAALPAAILVSIALFFGVAFFIAENAADFANQLVSYTPRLNGLIRQVSEMFNLNIPPTVDQLFQQLNPTRYLGTVAKSLQSFGQNAVFVLIYLGFIIASGRNFERKIVGLWPERTERGDAMEAFLSIRNGVERYLWVQTVTGLMLGVGSGIAMAAVGLDNAVFWAFLIFLASYIPIIGGIVGTLVPPVFALVQFPTFWPAVILFGVLQTIQFVVGNVVQPRMQGDSLNIDPVVVLLALAFWGAIWGVAGMFLSTPLTVMMMVILAQFPGTRWIAVLLSENGEPERLSRGHAARSPAEKPKPAPKKRAPTKAPTPK